MSIKEIFVRHGICATTRCTISKSGQLSANFLIYFMFIGEKPNIFEKASFNLLTIRSMIFVPQPSSSCFFRIPLPIFPLEKSLYLYYTLLQHPNYREQPVSLRFLPRPFELSQNLQQLQAGLAIPFIALFPQSEIQSWRNQKMCPRLRFSYPRAALSAYFPDIRPAVFPSRIPPFSSI